MLMPSANAVKEFKSMGVLLTSLSFCHFKLDMSVEHLREGIP